MIDNLAMLYDKGKIDGALIIAPKVLLKPGMNKNYQHTFQNI